MEEKCMVIDIIDGLRTKVLEYQQAILEIDNINLRQKIQEIRKNYENFQYELIKIAQLKGYYIQPKEATKEQIDEIKKEL